jgi:hypothetical protein
MKLFETPPIGLSVNHPMIWNNESRGRMAEVERKAKHCPSDLTGEEWMAISLAADGSRGDMPKTRDRHASGIESDPLPGEVWLLVADAVGASTYWV